MGYFDDLEIVQATQKLHGYHVSKPINPPYFSLCLLRKGEMIVIRDGRRHHLKAPFIFWAVPGHVYQFLSVEAKFRRETIWLDMGGARARRISRGLEALPSFAGLGVPLTSSMETALLMLRIINLNRHASEQTIRHRIVVYVEELIGLIYDAVFCGDNTCHGCSAILEAAELFKKNPAARYDLASMAREYGMSYETFRKKFKRYVGQPPHEFLLSCRMNLAVSLMRDMAHPVKEIADACGFDDLSSFSRMFRKKIGFYPRAFRKKMEEELS